MNRAERYGGLSTVRQAVRYSCRSLLATTWPHAVNCVHYEQAYNKLPQCENVSEGTSDRTEGHVNKRKFFTANDNLRQVNGLQACPSANATHLDLKALVCPTVANGLVPFQDIAHSADDAQLVAEWTRLVREALKSVENELCMANGALNDARIRGKERSLF